MADNDKPVKKIGQREIGKWNEPDVEPGDNKLFLSVGMKLFGLPSIDLQNSDEVKDRLEEYFNIFAEADLKPTVVGMAMALGLDRRRLWEIKNDVANRNQSLPTLTRDYIKKAYNFLENQWEFYMQQGKINPVSGIFLGKNNFGYQDKQEMVLTPNTNNEPEYSIDDIKQRLLSSGSTSETNSDNFEG